MIPWVSWWWGRSSSAPQGLKNQYSPGSEDLGLFLAEQGIGSVRYNTTQRGGLIHGGHSREVGHGSGVD